jgi:hypothetical protein
MNIGRTVFSQVMDFLPMREFHRCVIRYRGNYKIKNFKCLDQFLSMAFAQLTYRESLRDIETCLRVMRHRLYHMGFRCRVSRNTLANANATRDWRIYADFAQALIGKARPLYADDDFGVELGEAAYAFDSTTIDLCLSLFPWARFREHKAAVKIHTLLDLRGEIPCFIHVSDGKTHDVRILDELIIEAGAIYIIDRGYLDFERLYDIHLNKAFFVTMARKSFRFRRLYSAPADKTSGVLSDQTIVLSGFYSSKKFPEKLRRIRFRDADTGKIFVFLTNNFALPALTIALLYKKRWQIELFFRWIKNHLRIKSFYGTSENAVKTQIWTAVSVYVLVAIVKKHYRLNMSLYTILQILSVSLFEKAPVLQVLTETKSESEPCEIHKQLTLFEL